MLGFFYILHYFFTISYVLVSCSKTAMSIVTVSVSYSETTFDVQSEMRSKRIVTSDVSYNKTILNT